MTEEDKNMIFPLIHDDVREGDPLIKKYTTCYPVLQKCLDNLLNGKSVTGLLSEMGMNSIGLYAVNEFMDYVLMDAGISRLRTIRLYDRKAVNFRDGYLGRTVGGADALLEDYFRLEIEKIIICNVTYGNEIADEFLKRGIKDNDILTVDALIYSL